MRVALRILLGLFVGLLLAEGVVRVYLDVLPARRPVYISDPQAGYRLRPQAPEEDTTDYHVNSLGFRDREHPASRDPGTWRVAGIGDSFVFGEVRLRDNFLRIAESILNDRLTGRGRAPAPAREDASAPSHTTASDSGGVAHAAATAPRPAPRRPAAPAYGQVDIFLMGLGGYSPENYVGVLRGSALPTRPDFVLLCFFVGNDVTGIPTRSKVLHGDLYGVSSANPWLNTLRKSRLFVFAERYAFFRLRAARLHALRAAAVEADSASSALTPSGIKAASGGIFTRFYDVIENNRLPVFQRAPSVRMEELWRRAEGYLSDFDHDCRAAGVPWGLVIIPDEIQVDPDVRAQVLARLHEPEDLYDFREPQRRLKDFASRHSIPFLDLLPVLQAEQRSDARLYLPNDTHWSARGNRIAGAAVSDFLQQQMTAPPKKPSAVKARST